MSRRYMGPRYLMPRPFYVLYKGRLKNMKVFNIYFVIDRCKDENKSRFDNEDIFHYNH